MTALDDLATALQAAERSVFRLEGRQDYPDDELWQAHLRGEWWEQDPDLAWWCSLVSANHDRGVTMTRVRVVTEPWTAYTRWEIEQHYPHNLRAGENVRLVHAIEPWPTADFWLVDDERAWLLHYARGNGSTMTVQEVAGWTLPGLYRTRREALARSIPLAASPA